MATSANSQPLDLTSLLSSTRQVSDQIGVQAGQVQEQYNKAGEAEDETAKLYTTIGQNNVIIDSAKNSADFAVQKAKIAAANKLGTNLKESSTLYDSLISTVQTEYAEKSKALDAIQQKSSVGFFENPIQWLFNQLTINDDIDRHNAANNKLQAATDQISTLNNLTQQTNLTQTQLSEPLTQASISASADNAAANAAIAANKARAAGYVYNAEGIKAVLGASKDQIQLKFSMFGAEQQERQIGIALAHLEQSRKEFDWKVEEKKRGQDADAYFISRINEGMKLRLGDSAPLIEPSSAKATQILSLFKSNSPVGEAYRLDYQAGERMAAYGVKSLATSPANAADILFNQNIPVKLAPAQEPVKDILKQAITDAQRLITAGTLNGKDRNAVDAFVSKRAQEILDTQAERVKPGDSENVFSFNNLPALIKSSPAVSGLPVVQKVIAPAINAGVDLNDPNKVFGLVGTALKNKTISYPEAIELSTVYSQAQNFNIEARQLTSLGFVPRYSYNVKIQTNALTDVGERNEIVDLTKPDLVGRALNKFLASSSNAFAQGFPR